MLDGVKGALAPLGGFAAPDAACAPCAVWHLAMAREHLAFVTVSEDIDLGAPAGAQLHILAVLGSSCGVGFRSA